ncbi:MAG: LysR family transcriptional regulator [Deltaproteobacteria bacterium]|nr:LysR family transcriptional regulator [Deltaproteobacteria bacterium]
MDLWRLQIFCQVVELRSFSRAAEAVFLSQPTVSSHIKDLEEHFSCRLVDRLGREVIPTKAGELLYTYARKMISLREETERALAEFHGKIKGHLTIGGSTIPGGYILPPLLGSFKKIYPEVAVTIIQRDSAGVVLDTLEGRVELGIVGAATHEPRLDQEKVMDDEMFLIVPAAHKWTRRASIAMQDLVTEPFVMREPGSGTRKSLEELLDQSGHRLGELNVVAELGSTEAVRQAIKAGVGVSVLPECAVADELTAGTLMKVKIRGISFPRSFYLITHKYRTQSPLCRAFVDFLRQQPGNNIPGAKK